MPYPSKSHYLESKVLTASQPQLQIMLLDGAVRYVRQALQVWADDEAIVSRENALGRAIQVVEELTRSAASGTNELSKQLENQYAAIYHKLVYGRLNHDLGTIEECLKRLEFHRETWSLAYEKLESEGRSSRSVPAPRGATVVNSPAESFSLEA